MGIKNLWSLTVDEALVADKIKSEFEKTKYEVFFPVNTQMKEVDMVFMNLENNKTYTLQVKGSRTYEPKKSEKERYGNGSAAWFTITRKSIFEPTNKVDYYVFVLHSFVDGKLKKELKINYLILPNRDLMKVASKKILRKGGKFHFFIWVDPAGRRAFDFNNRNKEIPLSKYLDNWSILKE